MPKRSASILRWLSRLPALTGKCERRLRMRRWNNAEIPILWCIAQSGEPRRMARGTTLLHYWCSDQLTRGRAATLRKNIREICSKARRTEIRGVLKCCDLPDPVIACHNGQRVRLGLTFRSRLSRRINPSVQVRERQIIVKKSQTGDIHIKNCACIDAIKDHLMTFPDCRGTIKSEAKPDSKVCIVSERRSPGAAVARRPSRTKAFKYCRNICFVGFTACIWCAQPNVQSAMNVKAAFLNIGLPFMLDLYLTWIWLMGQSIADQL